MQKDNNNKIPSEYQRGNWFFFVNRDLMMKWGRKSKLTNTEIVE